MAAKARPELADALDRALADNDRGIVRSSDLSRGERERLVRGGYLGEVFKGWYFLTKPSDEAGQSTAWYAVFWDFLAVYLRESCGDRYCLSAVSSLDVHLEHGTVPKQVIVMTARGGNRLQNLPFDTSVLIYKAPKKQPVEIHDVNGLRVMPLPLALVKLPPTYFAQRPIDAEIALRSLSSTADLSRVLLSGPGSAAAGRIVGAYEFLGETRRAEEIRGALNSAGVAFEPENPFETEAPVLAAKQQVSPYAARIEAMFHRMRDGVLRVFESSCLGMTSDVDAYLEHVDDVYQYDAYNSLSIEGYHVTPGLVQRIRDGDWDPDHNPDDRGEADAFAAKGYLEAFKLVKESVRRVFTGEDAIDVITADYSKWYQALFSAAVTAGFLEPHHLAGFRNDRVFIKGSRHVPPPHQAVGDSMDALLAVLQKEPSPIVRAVLGHFLFEFVHPYMDGNGRMGRFLMNVLLAAGRYPWTIIRVRRRAKYMSALEKASCEQQIEPFAEFVLQEMRVDWSQEETHSATSQ